MTSSWLGASVVADRVLLRPLKAEDQPALIAMFTDPEARRFVGGAMSAEAANSATTVRGERWGHFMICDRTTDAVIGTVSFARKDAGWDLSYQLAKSHWGQGLATEAVRAALRWFFTETDAPVVTALTQEVNEPSIQLLQRLGGSVTERTMYRERPQLKFAIPREAAGRDMPETPGETLLTSGVILRNARRFVFQFGYNAARDALGVVRLGGHLAPGESPDRTAVREAFEEANTRVKLIPSPTTFRYEASETTIELVPRAWGAGPPEPLLVAEMTESGVGGLSVTYLAESFDSPTPAAETQALVFLTAAEVPSLAGSSLTLGEFIEAGGVVKDPSGLPRHFPLRPHGQVLALSILLERAVL